MRADMRKVLCERPRAHSRWNYHDVRAAERRQDYDDLPNHQGMRRPYGYETKEFSDLLGPLRNYMRNCVGRPWDDMWSEICASVPGTTVTGNHLRDHARQECDIHTTVIDGKVISRGGRFVLKMHEPRGLYVDPRDGLIYYNETPSYHFQKPTMIDGLAYRAGEGGIFYPYHGWGCQRTGRYPLKVIKDQRAMQINGIWYWIIRLPVPAPAMVPYVVEGVTMQRLAHFPRYDFVLQDYVKEGHYYADKRQMASRDLRQNGLRND